MSGTITFASAEELGEFLRAFCPSTAKFTVKHTPQDHAAAYAYVQGQNSEVEYVRSNVDQRQYLVQKGGDVTTPTGDDRGVGGGARDGSSSRSRGSGESTLTLDPRLNRLRITSDSRIGKRPR